MLSFPADPSVLLPLFVAARVIEALVV